MLLMAVAKRKPLSFNTTLRNPERIAGFLSVLCNYEGKILTNEVIEDICCEVLIENLYVPNGQTFIIHIVRSIPNNKH